MQKVVDLLEVSRRRMGWRIFISHDLAVVRVLSDEIMVMKSGKVVERGTAEAIFDRPRERHGTLSRRPSSTSGSPPSADALAS